MESPQGFAGGFPGKGEQSKGTETCHQDTYRDTRTLKNHRTLWVAAIGHSGHPQGCNDPALAPSPAVAFTRICWREESAGKKDDENSMSIP